jgi:Lon protease-like protein
MIDTNTAIPLFPLNVVLFPGMMLPLHIFEQRYKVMIRKCLSEKTNFGVILTKRHQRIKPGKDVDDTFEEFYSIGTTARITAVEHLKDGRMNLITIGQDRFIIREFYPGINNFLIGHVEPLPMYEGGDEEKIKRMTTSLRAIVQRYINHLADASGEDLSGAKIPTEPLSLAFLAGTAIQGPSWSNQSDKQRLLSTRSLPSLIARTIHVLDKEDKILAYMLKSYRAHQEVKRLPFVDYSLN